MTLMEFESLELSVQLQLLVDEGVPIGQIRAPRSGHLLYALYNFYVELDMSYKKDSSDVTGIEAFRLSPRLNKYLNQIDLTELGISNEAA